MTKSTCTLAECDDSAKGRGFCQKHYARWRRWGDPNVIAAPRQCRYCFGTFSPDNGRQVVCLGCRHKKQADYNNRYRVGRTAWRAANQDHLNELARTRRALDPERAREYSRAKNAEWRRDHPGYFVEHARLRRARKLRAGVFAVTQRDKDRLLLRYGSKCFYCGARGNIEWDHVLPLVRGGAHSIGNLLPACRTCNASKGSRTVMEFRLWRARMSKIREAQLSPATFGRSAA